MKVIVLATEEKKNELLANALHSDQIHFVSTFDHLLKTPADIYIDLLFEKDSSRINSLKKLNGLVIIDSVVNTLEELQVPFIRINGWPGFMSRIIEGSCLDESLKKKAEEVFRLLNKKIEWLPDEPGFITARVICAIINEAYFSLEEGISTKEGIDLAMRLGTAYPYGPFEWAKRIGIKNIVHLLEHLNKKQERYNPSALLLKEGPGDEL